jgi:hypothetical protein
MVFFQVLASLFAMVLVAAVNANPVASPEANTLSGIAVLNNLNYFFPQS